MRCGALLVGMGVLYIVAGPVLPRTAVAGDANTCASGGGDQAIAACTNEIKSGRLQGRNLARTYNSRGHAYHSKGDDDRALADYGRSIGLDPKFAWPHNNRGVVYDVRGDKDLALVEYNEAIRLDPGIAWPYVNRGYVDYDKGDTDRAFADFTEAIRLDPKIANAFNGRGNVYNYKKNDKDRALVDYNEAIRLDQKYAWAYANRGNDYYDRGDKDHALADYDEAIRLDPKIPNPHRGRGVVYYDRGEKDRALTEYGEAIRLDPKYARTFDNRGDFFHDKGDNDGALADYQTVLRLTSATDPLNQEAASKIAALQAGQAARASAPPPAPTPAPAPPAALGETLHASAGVTRAAMLIAAPNDPQKPVVSVGSAVWSLIPASAGDPSTLAVRVEIEVPDQQMRATVMIRKNADISLPATNTIDLSMVFANGAEIEGFKDMALPQLRNEDAPKGEAISGVRVKIDDDHYLVGLTRSDAEAAHNFDLLANRNWFDFPLLLKDDRIAKLTFEKGAAGERIIAQALDAWNSRVTSAGSTAATQPAPANPLTPTNKQKLDAILNYRPASPAAAVNTAPVIVAAAHAATPPPTEAKPAAPSVPGGRRVALVIANSRYHDAPLDNPAFDAAIVEESLRKIGFTVTVKKDLDLDAFEQAIVDFADQTKGADLALFYFAGHGFSVASGGRQQNLLMATSANFQAKTALALQGGGEPLEHVEETIIGHARATLIFVDACRNLPTLASRGVGSRGFERLDADSFEGAYVVLSTRQGKTAQDGDSGKGSPFARAFAAVAPTPGLRIEDAYALIREKVRSETSGEQVPDVVRSDLPVGGVALMGAAAP